MELKAMHLEVEGQLDDFSDELRTERAQKEALKIAKQQLQSQLKHMVKAEKDLTKGQCFMLLPQGDLLVHSSHPPLLPSSLLSSPFSAFSPLCYIPFLLFSPALSSPLKPRRPTAHTSPFALFCFPYLGLPVTSPPPTAPWWAP